MRAKAADVSINFLFRFSPSLFVSLPVLLCFPLSFVISFFFFFLFFFILLNSLNWPVEEGGNDLVGPRAEKAVNECRVTKYLDRTVRVDVP